MANEPGSGVSPPICSCDCGGRHAEAHVAELESDIENLKAIQRHCDDIHAAWQEANTRVTTLTAQVSALTKANHNIIADKSRLEATLARLREGLKRYGRHDVASPWNSQCTGVSSKGCVCGLDALLTEAGQI